MDGPPRDIADALEDDYIEICKAIHNYSFDIFRYRVTKRKHNLSEIRRYIEEDQTDYFSDKERFTLLKFLDQVDQIITKTTKLKQFPTNFIKALSWIYSSWTHYNLLPKDPPADNKLTLLDRADT
jgi:hypothetical protein